MTENERRKQFKKTRTKIAMHVMASIAGGKCDLQRRQAAEEVAAKAVEFADALLKKLSEK